MFLKKQNVSFDLRFCKHSDGVRNNVLRVKHEKAARFPGFSLQDCRETLGQSLKCSDLPEIHGNIPATLSFLRIKKRNCNSSEWMGKLAPHNLTCSSRDMLQGGHFTMEFVSDFSCYG